MMLYHHIALRYFDIIMNILTFHTLDYDTIIIPHPDVTSAVINHDINIAYDNFLISYYKTGRDIANMPYTSSITS